MPDVPTLSIVSPVYRAEKIVPELVKRIVDVCERLAPNFEIVLVEDGSPDNSWWAIAKECNKDPRVKGIKLSRNFGQHYAITAGLSVAAGKYVAVMDCDLQDNPKYLPELYAACRDGNDVVLTYKRTRRHGFFKNLTARAYFKILNYLLENDEYEASKSVGAYSMLSRKAVDAFLAFKEYHRHYLTVVHQIGFKRTHIEIEHEPRFEGKSSYTFKKLLTHALHGITSQSDKLLRLAASLGFFLFVGSLLWIAFIVLTYFRTGLLDGYASIMCTMLLGTGLILMSIGIMGLYVGNIFSQVKERPLFLIDKTLNLQEANRASETLAATALELDPLSQ
jgi:polyisoprenyl-phosphate glycosyltransferase